MALTPWIRIGQPLEAVLSDYECIFDAWEQGGIRGLVFGRLLFADEQGQYTIPAFKGDRAPYQKRGLKAHRRDMPLQPAKEKRLHAMLANAKDRGWTLMIFAPASGTIAAEGLPLADDPYGTELRAAAWEDIFAAFPEADGGIVDGWTESAYELTYHHGNAVFRPLSDGQRQEATARGYDAARLDQGRQHLHRALPVLHARRSRLLRRLRRALGDEPLRHQRGRALLAALATRRQHLPRTRLPPSPRRVAAPPAFRQRPALGRVFRHDRARLLRLGPNRGFALGQALLLASRL